jgi:uncharacterized protein (TIGR02147 family)
MSIKLAIKDYLNYREYLRNYYELKKSEGIGFSYTVFANLAGFKSRNFLRDVINGNKNLSNESVFKVQNVLKLGKKDFKYFNSLVQYNQATDEEEKAHCFDVVMSMAGNHEVWRVRREQFEFYSRCFHNSLREFLRFYTGPVSAEGLARILLADVSAKEVKQSLELMCDLGLLLKEGDVYTPLNEAITTGDEVISQAIMDFHKENLRLAGRSLIDVEAKDRDISCLVLGVSDEGFDNIKGKIQSFRKEMAAISDAELNPTRVIHLAMQAFPTTHPVGEYENVEKLQPEEAM